MWYVVGTVAVLVVGYLFLVLFRIEAKVDRLLRQFERPADVAKSVPQSVQDLARAGLKLEAIKLYREQTGCSLKEAKDAVDAFTESRDAF